MICLLYLFKVYAPENISEAGFAFGSKMMQPCRKSDILTFVFNNDILKKSQERYKLPTKLFLT